LDVAKSKTIGPSFPPGNPIHQGLVGSKAFIPPYGATCLQVCLLPPPMQIDNIPFSAAKSAKAPCQPVCPTSLIDNAEIPFV